MPAPAWRRDDTESISFAHQARRVGALIWSERRTYLTGSIFVLLSICTALAYPYVVRLIIDDAIPGGNVRRLDELALLMVAILLIEAASTCGRDYFFGFGAERVGLRLRRLLFRALLIQDIQFFDARNIGEITTRLWADVPPLEMVLGEDFADTLRAALFSVCATGLLFYTSPRLTLLLLLAVPPIAFATSILGRRVKSLAAEVQHAHGEAGAAATEVLAGVRTVRSFGREDEERQRYDGHQAQALSAARKKARAKAILGGVSLVAGECAALLAIWVGGNLIIAGRMTTGSLISFILYAVFAARGFRQASRFAGEALRAIGATQWAFDLLAREPRIRVEGGKRPSDFDRSIVLERVRFRYPTRPEVEALRGIDLRIAPGEVVAIVGKSGSGKSTLLNLILRFYDPDEGRVLVGGHDVRTLDPGWLRAHVSAVMQEPTLFSRTVGENISYGAPGAEAEAVTKAARIARADEFIDHLPGGYGARVGDRGVQISGGQRQRLAIARAVLMQPQILVLDEATSALDPGLDALVRESLRTIGNRPTMVIIAHRLSTVARMDRVVVVDQGRILESGTHEELLRNSAAYRQLVESQLVAR